MAYRAILALRGRIGEQDKRSSNHSLHGHSQIADSVNMRHVGRSAWHSLEVALQHDVSAYKHFNSFCLMFA